MHSTLKVGLTAFITITVTEEMCPAFDGIIVHRVYSTWSMAHHMEIAARKVLAPHLEPNEEGIGAHLSIDHLAPVPVGRQVRIDAEAIELDVSTLICAVRAYHLRDNELKLVGSGRQVQRILPKSKLEALIRRAAG